MTRINKSISTQRNYKYYKLKNFPPSLGGNKNRPLWGLRWMPGARWLFCVTLKIWTFCLHFVANWKWCRTLPLFNYSTPGAKNTFSEILIRRNSPLSSLVIWKEGLREVQFWLTRHPREVKNGKIQFDYIILMNQLADKFYIPHNFSPDQFLTLTSFLF